MTDWWESRELVEKVLREAESGNAMIQCELAAKLMEKGFSEDGILWYKRAAAQGNTDAMFNLGIIYMGMRNGLPAVPEQAFFWFEQGSAKGDAEAKYMAAQFLLDGYGTMQDVERAGMLAEEALKSGFSQAAELLKRIPGRQEAREAKMNQIEAIASAAEGFFERGDFEGALPNLEQAVDKSTELLGEADACTLMLVASLANAYSKLGKYDLSIACNEKIVSIKEQTLPKSHPEFLIASLNLSSEYGKAGKLQSALLLTKQAYNITQSAYEALNALSVLALNRYAADLCATGKFVMAKDLLENLLTLADAHMEKIRQTAENYESAEEALLVLKRIDRSKALFAHCEKVMEEHAAYFALSEDRREYAWICAEIYEMLSALPIEYQEKIDEAEMAHYKEQAALASCYVPHMTSGDGVEMDPYADALQALLSLKYLMPPMVVCAEDSALARVKAVVTWLHNELCLILTIYAKNSIVEQMTYPVPIDYVKGLNKLLKNGEPVEESAIKKVVSVDGAELRLEEEEGAVLKIHFAYQCEQGEREVTLYYEAKTSKLHAPEGFTIC